ncbi:MAG: hypothetical protein ACFFCQ_03785 [Promethearchaeota archaeon]
MSRKERKDKKTGLPIPPGTHPDLPPPPGTQPDLPTPPPTPPDIWEEDLLKPSILTGPQPTVEDPEKKSTEADDGSPLDPSFLSELKTRVADVSQKGLSGVLSKAEIEEKEPLYDKKEELQKTAREYEAAGWKQEESGLYANAAVFFACSTAALALADGPTPAAMNLANYARRVSSTTVNHPLFQSAKIGLKGSLTNDKTKIAHAIRLMEGVDFFSRDDKSLFKKFLRRLAR